MSVLKILFRSLALAVCLWIIHPAAAKEIKIYIDSPVVELPFPIEEHNDPTANTTQSFDLGLPSNVTNTVEYDPVTGTYIFKENIGENIFYRPPSMMTLEEYLKYMQQKEMEEYWKEKVTKSNEQNSKTPLIPPIKIDSDAFRNIFGSDEISIRPQGSVELSFGVNHSRYDNPILPENQRKITRFDFNQQIQMNLVGQIGKRVKLSTNYNTRAAFDFENISNLRHSGDEDDLLQLIELGNIKFPMNTTLIPGSSTLFGAKTRLQFGRLTVDAIASQSRGQKQVINVAGGAQTTQFNVGADAYEQNKHYFLGQYFYENYDNWMSSLPIVSSPINITRIEVWVTNRQNITENTRNIIAFADLGEATPANFEGSPTASNVANPLPRNDANNLYEWAVANGNVRSFFNATSELASQVASPGPFSQAFEFEKVENARKLTEQEFTYNALLGYISLNMPLNADEVLGVAYEYTLNGRTYQVGEFSYDGITGTDALYLKMLRSTILSPKMKIWDLMMKNVYSVGGFQLNQQSFRMDLWYNNPETSLPVNFMPYPNVDETLLVELLNMDKLNINNQPFSDGIFDFAPLQIQGNRITNGGTINPLNGRVYLSTAEPFGRTLRSKLIESGMSEIQANMIAFTELYDSTQIQAQLLPRKNRFSLKGEFKSAVAGDIPLNALNVPKGGVTVIAGGTPLKEGVDYTVDYSLGRVKILNTSILESNVPIQIQVESNSIFGFQQKTYLGTHLNYRVDKDFNIGATWLNAKEKPLTPKVNIGDEPYSNHMLGLNMDIRKEVPLITKLVDALPIISTSAPSFVSFRAEGAYLLPGTPRGLQGTGGTSYIDDFEASQSLIDLRSMNSWKIASIPQGQPNLFPEASLVNNLELGYNRALLAWYSIDPLFYQNNNLTPAHIQNDPAMLQDSRMRIVLMNELFPNLNLQQFTFNNVPTLDLAFYPRERGMYNYDTNVDENGLFLNPRRRWGGIMRQLSTTNFEQANIEFIQFWLLDPFNDDATNAWGASNGGDLYFNLGNVSEDVLRDSRKSFEHGLPVDPNDLSQIDITPWARVPKAQTVVNAFDNDQAARANQDVGMDGMSSVLEQNHFQDFITWVNNSNLSQDAKNKLINDPSSDDYIYYRDDRHDAATLNILERYKRFNGLEGNSPTLEQSTAQNALGYPTQATNAPDIEDNNEDNNLSESEAYFQYKLSLRPNEMNVGQNYITSISVINKPGGGTEKWYQFRVPVFEPEKAVNGISDFRTIRFMRMFLSDWDQEVVLRFARLELVRGEWRRYAQNLNQPGDYIPVDPNLTAFNIGVVNIEEHDQRVPIRYVLPPGIQREIDPAQIQVRQLNEQSMVLSVCNLQDGDARAGFRNINFNLNNYRKMKMFVHAEAINMSQPLADNDVTVFVRLGTDMEDNYYEYELPLKLTPWGASSELDIWPEANNIEIVFDHLTDLKRRRNNLMDGQNPTVNLNSIYTETVPNDPTKLIRVKGNPNLQGLRVVMIGVRNPKQSTNTTWPGDDGQPKCVEVWVNELRLTDFLSEGGGATVANLQVQAADLATVNMNGSYYGRNWGSVESRVQERQRDTRVAYDANATVQLGRFFGPKARISMPFFWSYSIANIRPEFDPFYPDIRLTEYTGEDRRERQRLGTNSLMRRGYNFNNVRRERGGSATPKFYDVENWSASYGFNEMLHRDFNLEYDRTRIWKGALNYNFNGTPKLWEPFKDVKLFQKSKWWTIVKEAGIYLGPKSLTFNNNLLRTYNERLVRNMLGENPLQPSFNLRPVYIKDFTWNRHYQVRYDVTKNLKVDYTANARALFVEPNGQIDKKENPEVYRQFRDTIISQLGTGATPINFNHNYNVSWTAPFSKIPALDWVTGTARYTGSYEWMRGPLAQPEFGNVIQNSRTVNLQGQLNFVNLYNKNHYFKKVNGASSSRGTASPRQSATDSKQPPQQGGRSTKNAKPEGILKWRTDRNKKKKDKLQKKLSELEPFREPNAQLTDSVGPTKIKEFQEDIKKLEEKIKARQVKLDTLQAKANRQAERRKKPVHPVAGFGSRLVMTVRNVSGTYNITDGTVLPGYNQDPRFFGLNGSFSAPTTGFVFGSQQRNIWGVQRGGEITDLAVQNGWLVQNNAINSQYLINHTQTITGRALLEPMKDLRVEVNLNRNFMQNSASFFRWNDVTQQFEDQSRFMMQNITYSTITLGSAFASLGDRYTSETFNTLLANLKPVSELLGSVNSNSTLTQTGFYDGYDRGQQEVVMGAFVAAYSGKIVNSSNINPLRSIPLPNWTLTYDGLSKFEFAKKHVRNFVIKHGYSSTFAASGMQTNLNYEADNNGMAVARDLNNNFIAPMLVQNLSIIERFSPLMGLDATWILAKNALITKVEYRRDRSVGLGLANNQVTEILGKEWIIGLGYKIDKLVIKKFKINGKPLESPLNFRFDLSIRDNITIIRKIIEETNQATAGQKVFSIRSSLDYNLTRNLTLQMYYDQMITTPVIATSYPTGNLNCGFRLRINLGGL